MSSGREAVRDAFAVLLSTALTGAGNPVEAVYNNLVGDFEGKSPVVVVCSAGTMRKRMTFQGSRAAPFFLYIHSFVLYSNQDDWGADDAEDRMDLIEEKIAGVLDANQRTDDWQALDYAEPSECTSTVVGGQEYRHERIKVAVEVYA